MFVQAPASAGYCLSSHTTNIEIRLLIACKIVGTTEKSSNDKKQFVDSMVINTIKIDIKIQKLESVMLK